MRDLQLPASVITCALALLISGCGEKEETVPAAPGTTSAPAGSGEEQVADAEAETSSGDGDRDDVLEQSGVPEADEDAAGPQLNRAEREALDAARRYVAELQNRDGAAVCDMLAPGALDGVELPHKRGACGPSLTASIGFRDPRGFPVWKSAEVEAIASLEVDGERATVIPTVFTRFADRDEPSVEDDPIYLTRAGDGWAVAKPSLTFYRAIGQDPPPQALAAP